MEKGIKSNNFLAFLLIVAVVVSVVGTLYNIDRIGKLSLTGYAGSYGGFANVTVGSLTSIIIEGDTNANFGTCTIITGSASGWALSNGTAAASSIISCPTLADDPITIQNDGNTNLLVKINGTTAANFIGGAAATPAFEAWAEDGEGASCSGTLTNYTSRVTMNSTQQNLCTSLLFTESTDEIKTYFRIVIPSDVSPAAKTATVTFYGTAA